MSEFRTRYSGTVRVKKVFPKDEGRTKGSFKDSCDVNNIVKKYLRTGNLPDLVRRDPKFGDFSDVPSFQEALERVRKAEETFAALPAQVRRECGNDPAVFLEKVQDPKWAIEHKLALPREVVQQAQAAVADPAAAGGAAGGTPAKSSKAGSKKSDEVSDA